MHWICRQSYQPQDYTPCTSARDEQQGTAMSDPEWEHSKCFQQALWNALALAGTDFETLHRPEYHATTAYWFLIVINRLNLKLYLAIGTDLISSSSPMLELVQILHPLFSTCRCLNIMLLFSVQWTALYFAKAQTNVITSSVDAWQSPRQWSFFSKLNDNVFEYFDPINILVYKDSEYFPGWPKQ